ncbi:hypothetical protein [Asanoa hainanensis]|uniref:hypothetical protein n=1 Tax=Asanoa hainanensis TaxID=560556 RepID=UPI001FEB5F08|nr:hypothetical protein [Asanoa hainanensis]
MISRSSAGARAAGIFRRTPLERSDQHVSWDRTDQAFFAAGACHILAWTCRAAYPDRPIAIEALRVEDQVFHVYARWGTWAFDHSGWSPESALLAVNEAHEGRPLERTTITTGLAEFCATHAHRMPDQYWADPLPRALDYLRRHVPPWER